MYNLSEKAIAEKYEDLLFTKVMALYAEEESFKIISEAEAEAFSDPNNIEKIYSKIHRRENFSFFLKYSKKIITFAAMVVFVAVISLSSVVVASAEAREAVAEAIYHLVLEEHEEYTRVSIGESTDFVDPELYDWEGAYAPTYIPHGFIFTDKIDTGTGYYITYGNDDEYVMFYQDNNPVGANFDTENADVVDEIMIGNIKGLYIYKDGYTIVSWNVGNTFMFLEGPAHSEEIVKIAKSIKPIEKYETPAEEYEFVDPELYDWESAYAPTYMPDGYSFDNILDLINQQIVSYKSGDNYINLKQAKGAGFSYQNTENAELTKTISIGESEGFLILNNGISTVTWSIDDTLLSVSGTAPTEEIIKIAEGIKNP